MYQLFNTFVFVIMVLTQVITNNVSIDKKFKIVDDVNYVEVSLYAYDCYPSFHGDVLDVTCVLPFEDGERLNLFTFEHATSYKFEGYSLHVNKK